MQILAFRILTHAGIENYFEERVHEIASTARYIIENPIGYPDEELIKSYKIANNILMHYSSKLSIDEKTKCDKLQTEKASIIEKSFTAYLFSIKKNHGIKEINIMKMLSPIGFPIEELDQMWLASIDSFGTKRGAAAHSYPLYSIRKTTSYADELKMVFKLIEDIKFIDSKLNEISPHIDSK